MQAMNFEDIEYKKVRQSLTKPLRVTWTSTQVSSKAGENPAIVKYRGKF